MVIGVVLIGMIAGLAGGIAALLLGQSFLVALLAYMALGAAGTVLVPVALYATARLKGAAKDETSQPPRVASGAMTILAVDDDPSVRHLIPRFAAEAGFPGVVTAGSGAEALDLLARSSPRFGCILLDVEMPGMDGIDLCARIRRLPAYRRTPVIMLTAKTEQSLRDRAFRAGATGYTTKPFGILDFARRLQEAAALPATDHGWVRPARV